MKKLYLIFFLGITFLLSDENRWSSTRFEHWWNKNFNSMSFREPFSFMPYRIKVGTFQYGGDDFWKQFFSEGGTDLNNSPFIIDGDVDFNFVGSQQPGRVEISEYLRFVVINLNFLNDIEK